jgi:hypothetical protein
LMVAICTDDPAGVDTCLLGLPDQRTAAIASLSLRVHLQRGNNKGLSTFWASDLLTLTVFRRLILLLAMGALCFHNHLRYLKYVRISNPRETILMLLCDHALRSPLRRAKKKALRSTSFGLSTFARTLFTLIRIYFAYSKDYSMACQASQ